MLQSAAIMERCKQIGPDQMGARQQPLYTDEMKREEDKKQILRRLKEKQKLLQVEMFRDKYAHKSINAYFELHCQDLEIELSKWKDKLESEVEDLDRELSGTQNSVGSKEVVLQKLTKLYEDLDAKVGIWEEDEEEYRLERIKIFTKYFSARKIQRWWRKILVEQNFKPKNKSNKKSKGTKGKKAETESKKKSKKK